MAMPTKLDKVGEACYSQTLAYWEPSEITDINRFTTSTPGLVIIKLLLTCIIIIPIKCLRHCPQGPQT